MTDIAVVSPEDWLAARKTLLVQEEELNRARVALAEIRQKLPVTEMTKDYVFEGRDGKASLKDLFEGRRQLIVYHFMFDPAWDEGCKHCSFLVDNIGHLAHLHARHTTLALVSRAPWEKIQRFHARMGWAVPWYSSFTSDFNYDFHVTQDESRRPISFNYKDKATLLGAGMAHFTRGEWAGLSVFLRQDGKIYQSYSQYDGQDLFHGTFNYLDLTPLGRQEDGRSWLRHHDKYEA